MVSRVCIPTQERGNEEEICGKTGESRAMMGQLRHSVSVLSRNPFFSRLVDPFYLRMRYGMPKFIENERKPQKYHNSLLAQCLKYSASLRWAKLICPPNILGDEKLWAQKLCPPQGSVERRKLRSAPEAQDHAFRNGPYFYLLRSCVQIHHEIRRVVNSTWR